MALAHLNVRVGADIAEMQRKMRDIRSSVYRMTRDLEDVGRSLSRSITLPVVGLATAVVKVSGDFQKSMNRVKAVSGATEEEFQNLNKVARELGRTTEFSASQAADGLAILAQAGFSAREAAEAIPGVLQLASAGAVDLGDAANIASNILRGFALETKELTRVNDVLVKTFTATNTDLRMLGESFQYVGPVAAGLGLTIEETAAAIGLMGNAGFQGSTAGTALRGALSRLINPSKAAAEVLKRLGVVVKDSTGQMLPFNRIVEQLEKSGASTADMMELFGDRAGPAMAALLSQGSEALRELTEKNLKSAGTAAEIAEERMKGFRGELDKLKSAAQDVLIAIGEAGLLKRITNLTAETANLLERLSKTNPAFINAATNIALVTAAIGPALIGLSQLIKAYGTLRISVLKTSAAMKAFAIAVPQRWAKLRLELELLNFLTNNWLGTLSAAGVIAIPFFIGIRNQIRQINKDIREGTSVLQSQVNLGGRGTSAALFAQSTQQDYSPTAPVSSGIMDSLDQMGLGWKRTTAEIPPYIAAVTAAKESTKSLEEILAGINGTFDDVAEGADKAGKAAAKAAEKAAKAAEEARKKALKAERDAQLKYLVPGELRIQDVTTEYDRASLKGLEAPKLEGASASMQKVKTISDELRESLTFTTSQWGEMSNATFGATLFMDAFGDALNHVAASMDKVAASGGGFMAVANEMKRAAQEVIGAYVRRGVMAVVSGTLEKSALLGPLAIPLGVAAGALAQGAFNSILNRINIPKFAAGGIAFGPTLGLMGEYRNAANNPEVIAPLDKLKNLIGGHVMQVVVSGRVSGKDLQLVMERNSSSSNRLRGY